MMRVVEMLVARMVLLLHTLGDGSSHFDWMLQCASGMLVTWRVAERPDVVLRLRGERLKDHRAVYLDHEGEVSGGRGVVRRVAAGECEWIEEGVRFRGRFAGQGWVEWRTVRIGAGDVWDLDGKAEV